MFFSDPPHFYGTQYAGKEEGISGRHYEMVIANSGKLFNDDFSPAFNSPKGKMSLQWFIDLYKAGSVQPGTTNDLWDDLGNGFATGTIALSLDRPGWSDFFNDRAASRAAGTIAGALVLTEINPLLVSRGFKPPAVKAAFGVIVLVSLYARERHLRTTM